MPVASFSHSPSQLWYMAIMKSKMSFASGDTCRRIILVPLQAALKPFPLVSCFYVRGLSTVLSHVMRIMLFSGT